MEAEQNTIDQHYTDRTTRAITFLAKVISFIFHPFILPLYGILILFFGNTFLSIIYQKIKINIVLLAAISTIIIPAVTIFLLYKINVIKSLTLSTRADRVIPLLIVAIGYMLCSYYLTGNNILHILNQLLWAAVISVVVCLIINFFWKISLHMTAMGGMIAFIIFLNFHNYGYTPGMIYLFIAGAGALATSRLYLQKHNFWQVLAGFCCGYFITTLILTHY